MMPSMMSCNIILNNKKVSYNAVYSALSDYFFKTPRESRSILMDSKGTYAVINSIIPKDSIMKGSKAKPGDVRIELHGSGEVFGGKIGDYFLSLCDDLKYYGAPKLYNLILFDYVT